MHRYQYIDFFGKESPSLVYENSERTEWIITEEDAERINEEKGREVVKAGEIGSRLLPPTTIEKAWERLVKLYGQFHCEYLQVKYFKNFKSLKKEVLSEVLKNLDEFIKHAETFSIIKSFEKPDLRSSEEEFLRLKHGYYNINYFEAGFSCLPAKVYGEYFLFREWVIEVLNKLTQVETGPPTLSMSPLYSIDPDPTIFKNADGTLTVYNKKPKNPFDLTNLDTFSIEKQCIVNASSHQYDLQFAKKIDSISPIYNISNFLTYHHQKTQDKSTFLKHIEHVILRYPFFLKNETKAELIKTWLKEIKGDNVHVPIKALGAENENDYWKSEYELRQFIDLATRWPIDYVFNSRTKENAYSIFEHHVIDGRKQFDLFSTQLKEKLSATPHWKAIELDLHHRFIKMINQYIKWFNKNKDELQKFEPYNPYFIMLNVIESTRDEIEKYFPGISEEGYTATEANKEKLQQFDRNEKAKPTKSKLEFTDSKLRPIILELAELKGFDRPSTYLEELRLEVEAFKDFEFTCSFYIRVHHLCNENREKFWNESHKKDITQWLKKAPFASNIFDLTWTDYNKLKDTAKEKPNDKNQFPDKSEQKIEENPTRDFIANELKALDIKNGWSYAFRSESDYNTFLNLLTSFFENTPYSLPETPIRLKQNCMTRLAKTLRPIYKGLTENKLKSDLEFFNIIRSLNHFKDLTDDSIYKAITR